MGCQRTSNQRATNTVLLIECNVMTFGKQQNEIHVSLKCYLLFIWSYMFLFVKLVFSKQRYKQFRVNWNIIILYE